MKGVRVGVSRCLLGVACRYDGSDNLVPELRLLTDEVTWVDVCPEVDLGMPTPREPIRLEGPRAAPRMVGETSRRDWTADMTAWAAARVDALAREGLHGFVLKARSPSCGVGSTRRWPDPASSKDVRDGTGLFAAALARRLPGLPLVEETDLADAGARARFLEAVRAYAADAAAGSDPDI